MQAFQRGGRVFVFRNLHDPSGVVHVGEFAVRVAYDNHKLLLYRRLLFVVGFLRFCFKIDVLDDLRDLVRVEFGALQYHLYKFQIYFCHIAPD